MICFKAKDATALEETRIKFPFDGLVHDASYRRVSFPKRRTRRSPLRTIHLLGDEIQVKPVRKINK